MSLLSEMPTRTKHELTRGRRVGLTSVEGNRLPSESMEFWWQTKEPADCPWNKGYGWIGESQVSQWIAASYIIPSQAGWV